jgi:hypothetical protein
MKGELNRVNWYFNKMSRYTGWSKGNIDWFKVESISISYIIAPMH